MSLERTAFDNTYVRLPQRFYARITPDRVPAPDLLAWNDELALDLGVRLTCDDDEELVQIFSGNRIPAGAEPIALAYAGHQFGHFVPQLGDGRAALLGEVIDYGGQHRDVQLKGSGQTPFSRNGDGKSWLGPVIREYLISEAMHHLGVPTTRALAAVATGENVYRESALPGAVFTRVASSHIRVGTFQYFASRGDRSGLKSLADYAITRHYPEAAEEEKPFRTLFRKVMDRQAALVAHWMDIGFIHGVMNTDNTSISGETIDYGPCAFMDEFRFDKVFSSIDHTGRYAYDRQATIAQWNLARFAECLLLLDDDRSAYEEELDRFSALFHSYYTSRLRRKLGLTIEQPDDADLLKGWLGYLQREEMDYTVSFRRLGARLSAKGPPEFGSFEHRWKQRIESQPEGVEEIRRTMDSVNPLYIPRNHQVERAIAGAVSGDMSTFHELLSVLKQPFREKPGMAHYAAPPMPEQRVTRTFCGT